MNAKAFFFWAGVGVVTLAVSYLIIRWFIKKEARQLAAQQISEAERLAAIPVREAGFHAIAKDYATM